MNIVYNKIKEMLDNLNEDDVLMVKDTYYAKALNQKYTVETPIIINDNEGCAKYLSSLFTQSDKIDKDTSLMNVKFAVEDAINQKFQPDVFDSSMELGMTKFTEISNNRF